ncbi:FtsX-like permease family protein [Patescibacteria group bacterium]|nr:MAG: FtsX-like permease family protein [Patescibacteria group bacterium]
MKLADIFVLSTRMFRTRPTRTWLTILGISVGIGAVLFLVSLGYGLQNIIMQKIVFNQAMLSLTVRPGSELVLMTTTTLADFKNIPRVNDVAPMAAFVGQAALGNLKGNVELRGVDASFFGYSGTAAKEGGLYGDNATGQAVISEAVLKLFGIEDPKLILEKDLGIQVFLTRSAFEGKSLEIIELPIKFRVSGVVGDGQSTFIYIPLADLANYVKVPSYDQIQINVAKSADLNFVKEQVIAKGFLVASLSETIEQANKIFKVIQIVLGLFGAVALVVSSIGMFNTMTVTLLERTNEIGIMRAIGGGKGDMRNLFLSESVIIGFLGGLMGMLIGFLGGTFFNWLVNSLAARFGGAKTDLFLYPQWFLLVILGLSAIIGFLSGIFPARRAARMDPLEALRYK